MAEQFKLSRYISTTVLDDTFTLVYSTKTSNFLKLKTDVFNLIANKDFDKVNNDVLFELFDSEIVVCDEEDEFESVINSFIATAGEASEIFNFTIQPSANCQLGCDYCGQIHEKLNLTNHQSESILTYIKKQLRKYKYKKINITWYGAEPLLGLNAIRFLSKELIKYSELKEIQYTASIITNGLAMKESIFEELVGLKITQFQITLDGTESLHDDSRFVKRKKGKTYKIILDNIINAVNNPIYDVSKCNILIRCNVSKQNYLDIDNLIESIYKLKIHDRITMQFEPIHDWGKNKAHQEIGLSPEAFGEIETEYLIKLRQLGFTRNLPLLPPRKTTTCMTTNKDSEIVDAKGRITYCWEVPYTLEFDYVDSPFFIGNVSSNYRKKKREKSPLGNWYVDIKNGRYTNWCRECNFLPVCGGSCPLNWYKGNPACPSFKYNFEDRLSLQYLEDIKFDFING